MQEYYQLSYTEMHNQINLQFIQLQEELLKKKIKYEELKNILTPSKDKKEICLIFDSSQITSSWYGLSVFEKILPIIKTFDKTSVSVGDLLGENSQQEMIYKFFNKEIIRVNDSKFEYSNQYFLVYLNNLSNSKVNMLIDSLKNYKPFTGYFDNTYRTSLKSYISTILFQQILLCNNNAIISSDYEYYQDKNYDSTMYGLEDYGFTIKTISSINYSSFLNYKIEREVYNHYMSDQLLSLATISPDSKDIRDFEIEIADEKFEYLINNKSGSLSLSGLTSISKEELSILIKKKINSNYFYNLEFLKEFQVAKFNIVIELLNNRSRLPVKYLISMEYKAKENKLRVITMY